MNTLKQTNTSSSCYFQILKTALLCALLSLTLFGQEIDIENLTAELEPEIRRAMVEGNIPSASVALVSGDKVVWTGAFGESNLRTRTPATANTVYLIGSTFKTMSTVALLRLMEEGKFQLDDPVSKYLDFKIQGDDPKNPVTLSASFYPYLGANRRFRSHAGLEQRGTDETRRVRSDIT